MHDPLKYFRVEARELLEQLQSGLLELERDGSRAAITQRLLRQAHTLKGAARVVKQLQIAELAHQLEDLLEPVREVERGLSGPEVNALLAVVDTLARQVGALAPAPQRGENPEIAGANSPAAAHAPALISPEDAPRAANAPLEHVQTLTDSVAEVGFQLGSARQTLPEVALCQRLAEQLQDRLEPRRLTNAGLHAAVGLRSIAGELALRLGKLERELSTSLERATRELGQARDRVDQLRLVAATSIFGSLERTLRDAAVSLGKQAAFEARGGDIRLDAEVLTAVQRALVQAVRNAVAHGIEPVSERSYAGKPAQGRVTVAVERRGRQICFSCRDDGRGINLAEVRREAERLGRLTPKAEGPRDDELLALLLRGGISTSGQVSQVAGRGVGLDLIREALASVGGTVSLSTAPGAGTSLTLNVPASLAALEALIVEVGGDLLAIPLAAVTRAVRVREAELNRTAEGTSLLLDDQVVPFVPLAWLLRRADGPRGQGNNDDRAIWSAVVVGSEGAVALGVDRLYGSETLVARALPDSVDVDPTIAGVSLDADGNPRLLLDPEALLAAAGRLPARRDTVRPKKRSILVIDDSLTTRMLEQSILESAGYEVALATSAEQGLEMARERHHDLFLVDVEMPGMDGFGFIEQVRADPRLAATPAVLVTSRASPEDLARGRAAGANGHIDKGEFDQIAFLQRIGRLIQ